MECRYVWLYSILLHSTLTIILIGAAPTTHHPYTHDTSHGLSENKSKVDMTQIPFNTDHPHDDAQRNMSTLPPPTPAAGGPETKVPEMDVDSKFAHESTTVQSKALDITPVSPTASDTGNEQVNEDPRMKVENILTTLLYFSTTEQSVVDETETVARVVTEADGGKSTETYFINGLSDLLMENSGIDRIAEFVDEIANQHNSQLEKIDSSISTIDTITTPPFEPSTTESIEKIAEQVTNSVVKNALNTEEDGNGVSTTNITPTEATSQASRVDNHSDAWSVITVKEKNDSETTDSVTSENPPVSSTISQFTTQFDILPETGSTVNPNEDKSQSAIHTMVDTTTTTPTVKKSKSGKLKKKVSKTSVDTKKPFMIKTTAAQPQADLMHSTSTPTSTTTQSTQSPYATDTALNEIQQTTPSAQESTTEVEVTSLETESPTPTATEPTSTAGSIATATTQKVGSEWSSGVEDGDYAQPENEEDVLVVEIEETDNLTEIIPTAPPNAPNTPTHIKEESAKTIDMTDELFFPIIVDRNEKNNEVESTTIKSSTSITTTTIVPDKIDQEVPQTPSMAATPPQNAVNHNKNDPPIDRDSDTFFYISNTEVKVLESVPTPDTHKENHFFPEIYEEDVFIDFSNKNHSHRGMASDKLEEDIILSPLNFDPLTKTGIPKMQFHEYPKINFDSKIYNSDDANLEHNSDDNLSISYIGESFIEIKESTTEMDSNNLMSPLNSDVIIQPVAMPEVPLSIGVPVIGELPPQIELMPPGSDANTQHHNFDIDLRDTSHVFAHPGNYLVKNPSISAEIPILESSTSPPTAKQRNATQATGQTPPFVDDGDLDTSLSDLQTLFTACLATLTLLMVVLVVVFGVRYLWRKYRPDQLAVNGLIADSSTDPLAIKSRTLSTDELKSADSEYTINRSSDTLESTAEGRTACNGATPNSVLSAKSNHTGANGSVITMTLKNNHLIVETEERNDISRDARETKMHYSPSEKDGVFVVEVARGADSTGLSEEFSKNNQEILMQQKTNIEFTGPGINEDEPLIQIKSDQSDHQEVQIHNPPPAEKTSTNEVAKEEAKIDAVVANCGKTGLTQSDLSMSSSNGSNKDYCYGSQDAYMVDSKGYKGSSPRCLKVDGRNDPDTGSNSEEGEETFINRKPIVTGAIYKQDTLDFESALPLDPSDGGKSPKEDQHITEQHQLGNGELNARENGENSVIVNGETEKESFDYPAPPSSEEIKCLNDTTIIENNLDSLPPPPPDDNSSAPVDEQTVVSES